MKEQLYTVLAEIFDPYLGLDLASAKVIKKAKLEKELTVELLFRYPFIEHPLAKVIHEKITQAFLDYPLRLELQWKIDRYRRENMVKGLDNVKNIIAVGSGKGGVGKSTTAVNLALALSVHGARVGILDADIYGPNQPILLGTQQQAAIREDKRFEPIERYGLQTMSMGYLMSFNEPLVWRGPMISRAFEQMLYETAWKALDYLIVDLPPGTGDIQLTLAQKLPSCAAVVVSTPQTVALTDARKAIAMFEKVSIPVLGMVENMSQYHCPHCGHEEAIFGQSQETDVLVSLPLDRNIQEQSDQGYPIVLAEPNSKAASIYHELGYQVSAKLSLQTREPITMTLNNEETL